ncbi:MAG TPA: SDR family oxidoreductase [Caulobacterales bacterium]|nr:SDR family oxidoreductase [Caulobacterales bacterium]
MRHSLIIGGAGGIGSAVCEALAEAGHRVTIADRNGEAAVSVAAALVAKGLIAHGEACDATSGTAIEELGARIEREHGPIDILVPMAGVIRNDLLVKVKDDDFDLVLATHLKSTLYALRTFLPGMRARGYGRVVTMSSLAGRGSIAGASYAAAKSGIEGLTRTAAIEMARYGVTVNCVAPALIDAGMFRTVPKEYQDKGVQAIPMRRAGEPREVAACVRFLASEEASYITGQIITVCGGLSLGPL